MIRVPFTFTVGVAVGVILTAAALAKSIRNGQITMINNRTGEPVLS